MTNSDIVGLAERCEFAANAFLNLRETYNGDLRSQGAANAATLLLVTNASLFSEAADTILTLKAERDALRERATNAVAILHNTEVAEIVRVFDARAALSGSPEG